MSTSLEWSAKYVHTRHDLTLQVSCTGPTPYLLNWPQLAQCPWGIRASVVHWAHVAWHVKLWALGMTSSAKQTSPSVLVTSNLQICVFNSCIRVCIQWAEFCKQTHGCSAYIRSVFGCVRLCCQNNSLSPLAIADCIITNLTLLGKQYIWLQDFCSPKD